MSRWGIQQVVIGEGTRAYPLTSRILENLEGIEVVDSREAQGGVQKVRGGKATLELALNRGAALKPCPGTRGHICCGYQILHLATNCPMDCTYCVLQAYFQEQHLKCFINIDEILNKLFHLIDENPNRVFRIGTGEFTDSLALDPMMGWTDLLVPSFSRRKNAVLELKTKTAAVERLLGLRERKNIVVSWSLNSARMARQEEHRAPGLRERLDAARRCQQAGYAIGLHFDPMVYHGGWKDGYQKTVEMLDAFLRPEGVIWVSLGSLRFMPALKPIMRKRHGASRILNGEFVPGLDGKMRYFKPIRLELYAWMKELLDAWSRNLGLYLCMESDDVWMQAFGWSPGSTPGLSLYLDERARHFFG